MMKQAKIMQQKIQSIKKELKEMKFEASAGGGAVKVRMNGDQEILGVEIDKKMIKPDDLDMIEDMVMVAVNDAVKQSKEEAKKKMSALTGGMDIPGMS
ncbi:MAG: YbaB/EbfC family nucleoid-associated protein [Actinomycetota bacterium]|nr:YbaB/EbfC family nucleoid-associated protein [Actinomycetota bacterium]